MSWDALQDRESRRPQRSDEPKGRPGRRPNPSSRPPSALLSQNPRSRSVRARSGNAPDLPPVIEEELWFGGHDPRAAEDTAARSMAALVGRIVGAKPFPVSARRLADLTRKDVVRIEPIVQVLERDPALSARLLRLVNSAGYALRQSCTSVRHAATLVGTDRLHQIATTAAVLDLFDSRSTIAARIIEHCTLVGAFCRYFGAHLALPVDDLFTAGFMHDIGKMMLLETEGDQYAALLEQYENQPDSLHVAERSLYGFDHAVLAAHVLTEWNIPDPVPKIVAWHHEPTRAYRVSTMMAALVQTVRLADAAVCAMLRGVPQAEFSSLANTESASYLDISEPQLASMWDELQTLYRESIEQCRGENAPALDPRSLRPKRPLSLAASEDPSRVVELPLQFPCVVCGGPTFGNTCCACGGHMCPAHQVGREDWCTLCARDYHSEASEAPAAMSPRLGVVIGLATALVSVAYGYETGGITGGVRAGIGTVLLLVLAAVLAVIGHRWLVRFRFVRTRPDRTIAEAHENDGGVQSLAPPMLRNLEANGDMGRDSLSESIRLSGAMVEHVVIRDVPSIPRIIAPRPFDGLHGSALLSAPPAVSNASLEVPSVPESRRHTFDSERLMMQSQSLVTLPAPAHAHVPEQQHDAPPTSRSPASATTSVTSPSLATSDEPIQPNSTLAIEPTAVVEPATAVEPAVPVAATSLEPIQPIVIDSPKAEEPVTESLPESSSKSAAELPGAGSHPLAALGLHPERARPHGVGQDHSAPTPAPESATLADRSREGRTTLMGLTSPSEPEAIAPPIAVEPEPTPTPEPAIVFETPRAGTRHSTLPPASAGVVSLASVLKKSEPPPALRMPNAEDLAGSVAAAISSEMIAKIGPDLQRRIMDLVAERVAAAVAQRVLESMGQPSMPVVRARNSRAPSTNVPDSVLPEGSGPTKRPRKRVAKH